MSAVVTYTSATGIQVVLVAVRVGCGGYADGVSGGGTDGVGGGDRRDGNGNRLSRWEDNVANLTLGIEHNYPLAYAPGLEHHHPIMITLGETGGRLDRERER